MSDSNSDSTDTVRAQEGAPDHVTERRRQLTKIKKLTTDPAQGVSDYRKFNLKVPEFSFDDPELWFALLEGQFENFGITGDNMKFNNVLTHLDIKAAKEVKDIIVNPPATDRYGKIKNELIKRLAASHDKKVKQLLDHEELGDRRPSQFLRHLQDLAGASVPSEFLRTIWSNRLPRNIQTVLASQPTHTLEQLADLADRIQDIAAPTGNVAAAGLPVSCGTPGSSVSGEIAELRKMVEHLAVKLDDYTRSSRPSRSPERSGQRRRSQSRTRTRTDSEYRRFPLCWYHAKFGSKAYNCQKPCDYKAENNAGGR